MGVMQVMVSVVADRSRDHLRCIKAGQHKFVFLVRDHIYLVAAVRSYESVPQILLQLTYVYNQIVSILTLSQLQRIFQKRTNYDLRRLLTGAEKFFDGLINLMDSDPSFLLGAVRCLRMDSNVRDNIAQVIAQNAKVKVGKEEFVSHISMYKNFMCYSIIHWLILLLISFMIVICHVD